ncbi:hypothetical protein L1887_14194 [Cichorium endivia]|nr:hypothetical protein L1887_14194 [Cichorium endivia]
MSPFNFMMFANLTLNKPSFFSLNSQISPKPSSLSPPSTRDPEGDPANQELGFGSNTAFIFNIKSRKRNPKFNIISVFGAGLVII